MPKEQPSAGDLLRDWRQRRRLSQLALAVDAEISRRHLSFLESRRSQPSRDMVLRLTERLSVPLRERNLILTAAGFAPKYNSYARTNRGSPAKIIMPKAVGAYEIRYVVKQSRPVLASVPVTLAEAAASLPAPGSAATGATLKVEWRFGDLIAYHLDGDDAAANQVLLDARNALYAFVKAEDVLYIGKTARSIRKRYVGYCRPGKRQATNQRCHRNIKVAIAQGTEIRIFVFTPISHLRYADFEINLAAGLEDSLIRQFDPPWNGRERGQPISEEAEREEAEETETAQAGVPASADIPSEPQASSQGMVSFSVVLGPTYYNKGFLNPGVEASRHLGKDGDPIRVQFSDGSQTVVSKINRTANRTGAVRVVGSNQQIARWFQDHFHEGDTVRGRIVDLHTIEMLSQ